MQTRIEGQTLPVLYVSLLTGPGRIWLQTLTMPNLAHALAPYLGGETTAATAEGSMPGVAASSLIRRAFE